MGPVPGFVMQMNLALAQYERRRNSRIRNRFDVIKGLATPSAMPIIEQILSHLHVVENYPKDSIVIIIDCGTEDFYKSNHEPHENGWIKDPHDYIERPGNMIVLLGKCCEVPVIIF
jgi:hypothetical protein